MCIFCYSLIQDQALQSDETHAYKVINKLIDNDHNILGYTSQFPGYHYFSTYILKYLPLPKDQSSLMAQLRFLSLIICLLSLILVYKLAKQLDPESSHLKTIQFFSIPILFPYFFLIYSDVFSTALVLLAFYSAKLKKYWLAGLIGILSVCIRQNNILWLGFVFIYIFFEDYSGTILYDKAKQSFQLAISKFVSFLKSTWVFILGFIIFTGFVIINKGVTLHDHNMHPLSIHFGNIYFCLFLFFFLFLPLNIANLPKIKQLLTRQKHLIPIILFCTYLAWSTFVNDHPYNSAQHLWWLRNRLLLYITTMPFVKILFFTTSAYSVLSLAVTPLHNKSSYIFYPISILFLSLLWLIEARYYMIPIAFFLILKKENSNLVEYSTLAIFTVVSTYLFWGIQSPQFPFFP